MPSFLNCIKLLLIITINLSIFFCITNVKNSSANAPEIAHEQAMPGQDVHNDFEPYLKFSTKDKNSISNLDCNFNYSECSYQQTKIVINGVPDRNLRISYITEIAKEGSKLIPDIYKITHPDENISDNQFLNRIVIFDDPDSELAYTKIKFHNLINSDYDKETGIYLGKQDLENNILPGVLAHELTHYLKTPLKSDNFNEFSWIEEGVSDYVFDKLGYSNDGTNRYPHCGGSENYKTGYMCAADFFIFIENKYHKNIPREYVYMLENGIGIDSYDEFVTKLFQDFVGKDVDTLWNEYLSNK